MRFIIATVVVIAFTQNLLAQDVQWRGPNRDGIYADTGLLKEWPEEGPEVLFVAEDLGRGFSSAVATSDMIYASGIRDTLEYLTALNLNGEKLWEKPIGRCWNQSFPETRSTPTVEGNRLYMLTGMDMMVCFHALTGEVIWSVDLHEVYGSRWDMFGVSESVLIVGDKVITTPCGELTTAIALDKMTGELIWKSRSMDASRGNLSPILIEHCGKEYVITSTQTHMIGVDPENGEILWDYHYNFLNSAHENTTILANTPIYNDSCVWISNGWDVPSVMLEIAPDGRSVSEKFRDQTFDNQNHGVVLVDGYLYGSNFTGRNSGKWVCMNWNTGEIVWIGDFYNKGPSVYADGMLYIYEEKRGNMGLVKADPKKFELVSSFRHYEGSGPHWARPTIFNQMLLVRHGEKLTAYKIGS
ncbi:MAG: PQQ-binding-like beta-propeller repeat protein [Bacteroidales bacterium]|nr:PQQ-binding-like beta-propeller repeat protein [Bacteroidales bacterium]